MGNSNQETPQSDFPVMKSFKTVQKKFTLLGITPELAKQPYPLNLKVILALSVLTMALIFECIYIGSDASTFIDYTQSIFVAAAGFLVLFVLMILIFKVEKIFEFIDHCDFMINRSK